MIVKEPYIASGDMLALLVSVQELTTHHQWLLKQLSWIFVKIHTMRVFHGISHEGLQGTVAGREILILVCYDGPLMKDENPNRGDLEKQISTIKLPHSYTQC